MRLRRKPWIDEAVHEYDGYILLEELEAHKGQWRQLFADPGLPLQVELGSGKGQFIAGMAKQYEAVNFLGLEVQLGVIYYAARKLAEGKVTNAKMLLFDIANIEDIFAAGEVERFYINFCDPWPKARHAKRRLTYHTFLDRYRRLLAPEGEVHFKTDNEELFQFSLEEFTSAGWTLKNITYDLHQTELPNVKTEYEEKFSAKGQRIFRLEAVRPQEG